MSQIGKTTQSMVLDILFMVLTPNDSILICYLSIAIALIYRMLKKV
jgi:hypothetical protein